MIEEIKIDRLEELIHEMMIKIRNTYPTNSAEGNPIEIENAAAAPLVKCVTAITGSQSGTGTPSLTNLRPLTAFSAGEIEVSDEDEHSTTYATTFPYAIYQGTEDLVNKSVTAEWRMLEFDGSDDENWYYNENNQLVYINVPNGIVVDNESQLQVFTKNNMFRDSSWAARSSSGSLGMFYGQSSIFVKFADITSVDDIRALLAVTPLQVAYQLASPATSTVTVSNAPISAVHGYNKIESNTGDMEVTYITEEFEPLVPTT